MDQFEARVDDGFRMVSARLDAQRSDLNLLLGKPAEHKDGDGAAEREARLGRFRVADVIGFVSLCLIPVVIELIRRGG